MTRLSLALVLALLTTACTSASDVCSAKKATARTAWGEVGVRYALELSDAEAAVKEPTGRLAALSARPDAPPEGKAALSAEIAKHQAVVDTLQPKVNAAQTVSAAFTSGKASVARALATATASSLEGEDVGAAVARADEAAAACEGVD